MTSNHSTWPFLEKVKEQPSAAIWELRLCYTGSTWVNYPSQVIMKQPLLRAVLTVCKGNICPLSKQSLSIDQKLTWSFALFPMQNHPLRHDYCYQGRMYIIYTSMTGENQEKKLWFLFWQNTEIGKFYYLVYCIADHVIISKLTLAF